MITNKVLFGDSKKELVGPVMGRILNSFILMYCIGGMEEIAARPKCTANMLASCLWLIVGTSVIGLHLSIAISIASSQNNNGTSLKDCCWFPWTTVGWKMNG